MERLNDEAQWIILIGFIISVSLLFLALVIDESTVVGQTTAEGVLEFSKSDIRDMRSEIIQAVEGGYDIKEDIQKLSLARKNALIEYSLGASKIYIHYNNGVTTYDEEITT